MVIDPTSIGVQPFATQPWDLPTMSKNQCQLLRYFITFVQDITGVQTSFIQEFSKKFLMAKKFGKFVYIEAKKKSPFS